MCVVCPHIADTVKPGSFMEFPPLRILWLKVGDQVALKSQHTVSWNMQDNLDETGSQGKTMEEPEITFLWVPLHKGPFAQPCRGQSS